MSFKNYYELAKPGIIYGNAITVISGFILASGRHFQIWLFVATLIGISLVMASGCVFNNYIDRDIDTRMERTKGRSLVVGNIPGWAARVYGTVLGIVGFVILGLYTNSLTVIIAAIGFFFYVYMYTILFKRYSTWGTLVGAVSGAVPPVVGYCAVTGRFDLAALILFLIMVIWQMPHFFAIAIRRLDEYTAANVLILPVQKGVRRTKKEMLVYISLFILVAPLLTIFGYAGWTYFVIALALGLVWLVMCIKGFKIADDTKWARKMFLYSLIVLLVLFTTIAVGALV